MNLKSEFANEIGGLSGVPLKNQSTELIAEMYKLTKGTVIFTFFKKNLFIFV